MSIESRITDVAARIVIAIADRPRIANALEAIVAPIAGLERTAKPVVAPGPHVASEVIDVVSASSGYVSGSSWSIARDAATMPAARDLAGALAQARASVIKLGGGTMAVVPSGGDDGFRMARAQRIGIGNDTRYRNFELSAEYRAPMNREFDAAGDSIARHEYSLEPGAAALVSRDGWVNAAGQYLKFG